MQIFDDRFQAESGRNFHPESAWKRSSKTCMKLTNAELTVEKFLIKDREDARNM